MEGEGQDADEAELDRDEAEEYDWDSGEEFEEPGLTVSRSFGELEETEPDFGGDDDTFPRPPVAINIDWNDSPEAADFIVTAESDELSFAIAGVVVEDVVVGAGGRITFGISNSRYKLDCRKRK